MKWSCKVAQEIYVAIKYAVTSKESIYCSLTNKCTFFLKLEEFNLH